MALDRQVYLGPSTPLFATLLAQAAPANSDSQRAALRAAADAAADVAQTFTRAGYPPEAADEARDACYGFSIRLVEREAGEWVVRARCWVNGATLVHSSHGAPFKVSGSHPSRDRRVPAEWPSPPSPCALPRAWVALRAATGCTACLTACLAGRRHRPDLVSDTRRSPMPYQATLLDVLGAECGVVLLALSGDFLRRALAQHLKDCRDDLLAGRLANVGLVPATDEPPPPPPTPRRSTQRSPSARRPSLPPSPSGRRPSLSPSRRRFAAEDEGEARARPQAVATSADADENEGEERDAAPATPQRSPAPSRSASSEVALEIELSAVSFQLGGPILPPGTRLLCELTFGPPPGLLGTPITTRLVPAPARRSTEARLHCRRAVPVQRDGALWAALLDELTAAPKDPKRARLHITLFALGAGVDGGAAGSGASGAAGASAAGAAGAASGRRRRRELGVAVYSYHKQLLSGREAVHQSLDVSDGRGAPLATLWLSLTANAALALIGAPLVRSGALVLPASIAPSGGASSDAASASGASGARGGPTGPAGAAASAAADHKWQLVFAARALQVAARRMLALRRRRLARAEFRHALSVRVSATQARCPEEKPPPAACMTAPRGRPPWLLVLRPRSDRCAERSWQAEPVLRAFPARR